MNRSAFNLAILAATMGFQHSECEQHFDSLEFDPFDPEAMRNMARAPQVDGNRAATSFMASLYRAGVPQPHGSIRSMRLGAKGCQPFIVTDNAVTPADLTQDWVDSAVLIASGIATDFTGTTALTPQDNPPAVIVIEKMAIVANPGFAEADPVDVPNILSSLNITHQPAGGGDLRIIPAFEHIDNAWANKSVAVGPLYEASFQDVECKPLRRGPLAINLQRDTFVAKPLVAVDTTANIPFMLIWEGHTFSNNGWTSDMSGYVDEKDPAVILPNMRVVLEQAMRRFPSFRRG